MFFSLSKIFWAIAAPLTLIGLIVLVGAVMLIITQGRRGTWLARFGVALFLIFGFLPVGPNLMVFLETRYSSPERLPDDVKGIIVLGGAVNAERSFERGKTSLSQHAARLTTMIELSRSYPQARIIYSGGSARIKPNEGREAEEVQKLLKNMGVLADQYEFETASRNTYENMLYSKDIANPQPGDKWVLITSAFHMPRSAGVFQKGGWNVIPYPVDFKEDARYVIFRDIEVLGNFYKLQVATKEIVGIIAYKLTGKL